MIFEGFLLDVDYILEQGKAVIRLWCVDEKGEYYAILDPSFEPYFYAIPNYASLEECRDIIKNLETTDGYRPRRFEELKKNDMGTPVKVFKIFADYPGHVPQLRETVKDWGLEVREADILFGIRYIIDKGLVPLGGVRVKGNLTSLNYSKGILAESVESKPIIEYPPLRIMAFDCEMASPHGMPTPEKNPIIIISVATNHGETKLFVKESDENDGSIIKDFISFIDGFDPHIIVGYNSDAFDWPYLMERAKKDGLNFDVGKDGSKPKSSRGNVASVKLTGRLNVDIYRTVFRDLGSVKVKKLENVAEYLGVMKKEDRVNLSHTKISEYWNDESKRDQLYVYSKADVESTLGIAMKLLPTQYELARVVRYPLDEISKMGRGRMVESYLIAEAFKRGELVPPRNWKNETYSGGLVLDPVKGLHEDVACLDFSSMYPSIMISFNISPETITSGEGDFYVAPEVGYKFLKEPEGFFKKILSDLIGARFEIKKQMTTVESGSNEYLLLDLRQQGIKILTNSFYGYTGWGVARWYRRECAEATTAWGRYFIRKVVDEAESADLEVIYGDTDSIFIRYKEDTSLLLKKANDLAEKISQELPIELEIEEFYDAIFFTGMKKRYAGLTPEGEIIIKGLEVRRGDWCELAKEIQLKVIELILREKDPKKAVALVNETVQKIKKGEIPSEKFVIYKTLTKKISSYETQQAHVVAAKRALIENIEYGVGSKVPYIILMGQGSVSSRAFPAELAYEKFDIDKSYYVNHQIVPAAHRILTHFGYSKPELIGTRQGTLDEW